MHTSLKVRPVVLVAVMTVVAVVAALLLAVSSPSEDATAAVCPPGTVPVGSEPRIVPVGQENLVPAQYVGPGEIELPGDCRPDTLESFGEIATRNAQADARMSAPFAAVPEGAKLAAADTRQALLQAGPTVRGSDGVAVMHGQGPLNFDEDPFDSGQGIVDSTGRIDDFFYDPANDRLFAAIGTGGVWMSLDRGDSWTSVGESLPTQITSAVTWTPSGGPDGTLSVLTGEHTFGGSAFTGLGAYYSTDLGETWTRAEGPPAGTLAFALEADLANPDLVYAATGRGLWRSTDAGRTYTRIDLPLGTSCEGDYNIETCNYAHFITDVVIKEPGGVGADTDGGDVLAVVGYRAGRLLDVSGEFVHSEANGVFRSTTGEPGTWEALPGLAEAAGGQEHLGRTEFGTTKGEDQDHDIVYAIVEDAVLFNGGSPLEPIPDPVGTLDEALIGLGVGVSASVLNGVHVSTDFGDSWTTLADDIEMAAVCPVNQSVYCLPGLINPGVQTWYNMWIEPDPSRTDPLTGASTRLVLGMEEVWQNRESALQVIPTTSPLTTFSVIGAYYGGVDCLLVATDCILSSNVGIETTHPDQHDGIFLPTDEGGVKLLVGHDGGVSAQISNGPGEEFTQNSWILEQENGLDTLLPYSLAAANDGTVLHGLQDNGTALIAPDSDFRQFEIQGADGTATAIDPEDSSYGYASSQGHSLLGVSSDGFQTFTSLTPPADNILFVPPMDMNPLNSDHILTGGTQVIENLAGRDATATTWNETIDLGLSEREPNFPTEIAPPARQTSATALYGDAAYVGYCAPCTLLQTPYPYDSGIATNIGGDAPPNPGTSDGWHIVPADGLPDRYITDIAVDPYDPTAETLYATLGGYTRKWIPPGTGADTAENIGEGHVFVSDDGGNTFTDISGNLPDTPVLTVEQRGDQLLVGTDLGAYISSDLLGTSWAPLGGSSIAAIPVMDIQLQADDPDIAYLAVYGRGVMRYEFPDTPLRFSRVAGDTRELTAIEVSRATYSGADTVVLARQDVYADAIAGAPLAFDLDAPILLSGPTLSDAVAAEISRLGASSAVILGGAAALPDSFEGELAAAGIADVTRLGGINRFETAAMIADELGATEAWVVKGNDADPARGWEDALSIAPVAARAGQAVLLTETPFLPAETAAAVAGLDGVSVVGAGTSVSAEVVAQLDAAAGVTRTIDGATELARNAAIAEFALANGHTLANTWVARRDVFADSLSSGPSVATTGGVLLYLDQSGLDASGEPGALLRANSCAITNGRIAGGIAAVPQLVEDGLNALLLPCDTTVPVPPAQAIPGAGSGEPATEEQTTR